MVERPGAATAIGVLSIVFCSMSILGVLLSAAGLAIFRFSRALIEAMPEDVYAEVGGMFGSLAGLIRTSTILSMLRGVAAGLGLAGGIGLLANKRWSVLLSTVYGAGVIAVGLFQFLFVAERMNELAFYAGETAGGNLMGALRGLTGFAGVTGLILGSAYPVVVIVLVNLPRVREFYMAGDVDQA